MEEVEDAEVRRTSHEDAAEPEPTRSGQGRVVMVIMCRLFCAWWLWLEHPF